MTISERARALADARGLIAQALKLLDKAEALEAGAHLDAAIHGIDRIAESVPIRLVHTR